ncbi:MAG TPA: phage baseplate assembly protein V [Thermoanaerobaculia bacterium]|nr:phage baseplate assembly protein V [Thermoanaerobaculia bacterium]
MSAIRGVAAATVLDNDLPGGQVRVTLADSDHQLDCRVLQPYAGPDFGTFLIPEKGVEVLVAFYHGDDRLPVVLGCLWNGQDKPPAERGGGKDPKLIKTQGGHRILLDDSDGAKKIEIVDADGANRIVIDTAGRSITIETGGKLALRGREIEIEAQGPLKLKGLTIDLN